MSTVHRTLDDARRPVRVIQVGAGGMGQSWLTTVDADTDVDLVGVVDLNLDAARSAAAEHGSDETVFAADLGELIERTRPDAVINVTIPAAHHSVTTVALRHGLPVLGEKPAAATVSEALSLAAASTVAGELFMVSQSRRYDLNLATLRAAIRSLGGVGFLTSEHFKAPHFGGFRDEMEHPFLVDMAIHPFDMARYLLEADPIAVYCEEFNPEWSWYRGAAAASVVFEMSGGQRFAYQGSWCSPGLETSWNGQWRASGSAGSAVWDGDTLPRAEFTSEGADLEPVAMRSEGIAGSLAEFVGALRTGTTPATEIHANISSLAMVEAAVESASTGRRIRLDEVMRKALKSAVESETDDAVRALLMEGAR